MERVLGSRAGRLGLRMVCVGRRASREALSGTDVSGPRIVHVVPELAGAAGGLVGGAERYANELARDMARRVPTTHVPGTPCLSGRIARASNRIHFGLGGA